MKKVSDYLEYQVKTYSGQIITDKITGQQLNTLFKDPFDLNELKPFLPKIVEITSERGHTLRDRPTLNALLYAASLENSSQLYKALTKLHTSYRMLVIYTALAFKKSYTTDPAMRTYLQAGLWDRGRCNLTRHP